MISVIVPVFNAAAYLERCIDALLSQDLDRSEYEIIMVDNNSSDESVSIIEGHPDVKLLREPKQGSYAARNRGLDEARGEAIAFTDSDCEPDPGWLRECLTGLQDPETHLVAGHAFFDSRSWVMARLGDFECAREAFVLSSDDPRLYYGHTNNLAVKRAAIDAIGGFVEWMRGGDTIFVQSAIAHFSPRAVRFRPAMRVRHLEVNSVRRYYQKLFLYGRSERIYRQVVPTRVLTFRERLGVIRTVPGMTALQRVALLAVLGLGLIPWWVGSATAIGQTAPSKSLPTVS